LKKITSPQNPFIRSLLQLKDKAKVRQQRGVFLIEGQKEISLAFKGGYKIEKILFYPEICSEHEVKN
jgi:TrmH family RNA methyltransferase